MAASGLFDALVAMIPPVLVGVDFAPRLRDKRAMVVGLDLAMDHLPGNFRREGDNAFAQFCDSGILGQRNLPLGAILFGLDFVLGLGLFLSGERVHIALAFGNDLGGLIARRVEFALVFR